MRKLTLFVTFVVLILYFPWTVNARVTHGPLTGNNVGHASYWPDGLKEVVTSRPRVAGEIFSAQTFYAGVENISLYYSGDHAKLNEFLERFAKVKHDELILYLDPTMGLYGKNPRSNLKVKEPIPFNWSVIVSTNGLAAMGKGEFKDGPKTRVFVRYYIGDRGHLMGLEVPPNLKVVAGFKAKYRDAHKGDPTVQAIDAFISLRKKQQQTKSK